MRLPLSALLCALALPAHALNASDLHGTWRLVSSVIKDVETGAERNNLGAHPSGYITYGTDGRMITVATSDDRPNVGDASKLTDEVAARLFRRMWAYAGTYTIQGNSVVHDVDVSWNEIWKGTSLTREVQSVDGDRLVLTTKPQKGAQTGRLEMLTVVWEKVR